MTLLPYDAREDSRGLPIEESAWLKIGVRRCSANLREREMPYAFCAKVARLGALPAVPG